MCIRPTMHPVCITCFAIHLPRPTSNTLSALHSLAYAFYHADPSCPLPSPHSAQPRAAHNAAVCFGAELQQCSIRQKCIRRRSQALGGLGRRGCYLGQQPIAAHLCLYQLGMQHATLSSTHIQRDEHMESGSSGWIFHKQSTSTR